VVRARTAESAARHAALVFGSAVALTPLVWMVSASLMATGEASSLPLRFFPKRATLEHYTMLFTRLDLARHFLNSAIVTVSATLLSLLITGMAGYAFAKLRFRGRDPLFRALALALVVPGQVGMLPLFLLLRQMGFVNSYAGVLVPYFASVFGIFMIRQYALSVPEDLLDAARIDGAGELRIFASIVMPLIRPILVTLAAYTFLSAWNDFLWPLIILSDSHKYTLPVALASLVGEHVQDAELMMAGAVVTVIPALGVFLAIQRHYVRGIMAGGVKG
jgi:multiple sugar transport system permease protein